jgi:hypothetical protein
MTKDSGVPKTRPSDLTTPDIHNKPPYYIHAWNHHVLYVAATWAHSQCKPRSPHGPSRSEASPAAGADGDDADAAAAAADGDDDDDGQEQQKPQIWNMRERNLAMPSTGIITACTMTHHASAQLLTYILTTYIY